MILEEARAARADFIRCWLEGSRRGREGLLGRAARLVRDVSARPSKKNPKTDSSRLCSSMGSGAVTDSI